MLTIPKNVQDLRSYIPGTPDSIGVNALKNTLKCPVTTYLHVNDRIRLLDHLK